MQHKKLLPMCLNSFVTHECESYSGLLFAYFLLAAQEKVSSRRATPGEPEFILI
jgi:hypothetical protein